MDVTKVLVITAALITMSVVIFAGVRWSVLRAARRQNTSPSLDPQPSPAPRHRLPQRLVGGVLAVTLIIGGGYFAITVLSAGTRSPNSPHTQVDVSSPNVTVHGYYYAVQTRNYNTAWVYLAASRTDPGSKTAFISTAQSQDDLLGKVTDVWITGTELESESRVSIFATIQRGTGSTSDATLAVSQHGSSWLIDSINSSSTTMTLSGPSADV
jgi:hypothetical protein